MNDYQFARQFTFWKTIMREIPPNGISKGLYQMGIIKFAIFDERNVKHNRQHFHAFINNIKIASIYLDNFEVDFYNDNIKHDYKQKIVSWVKRNRNNLEQIVQKNNGEFEIPIEFYP